MPAWTGAAVGESITGSSLKASLFVVTGTGLQLPVNAAADRNFQAGAICFKRPRYRSFGPKVAVKEGPNPSAAALPQPEPPTGSPRFDGRCKVCSGLRSPAHRPPLCGQM